MKLQNKSCNGKWSEENRIEKFVELAAKFNKLSNEEVIEKLEAGKTLRYNEYWYASIRKAPPEKTPEEKAADYKKWQQMWEPKNGFNSDGSPVEYEDY